MERSLEEVVMLFDKRLASGEELSPDVCEGAVGSEMTRVGGGIPGIPSSNLFLNDFSNGGFVRRWLGVAAMVFATRTVARTNKHFMAASGQREGCDYSKAFREAGTGQ